MNQNITKHFLLAGTMALLAPAAMAQKAQLHLTHVSVVSYSKHTNLPNFIRLGEAQNIKEPDFEGWAAYAFGLPQGAHLKAYETKTDELGYTHTRYKEYVNAVPVEGSMIISHSKEGRITMVNGDFFPDIDVDQ